ncbi:MAG TPA: outer membrane beta-barrel protein [Thermodesulfovibrionales bacterium]|nr:outer membrane beta-barrel protein [Thermodesulfovibrionales bacterium]
MTEEYTDNIFCTNTDVVGGFKTIISPGFNIELPMVTVARDRSRYHLDMQFRLDSEEFDRFTVSNGVGYIAMAKFGYEMPSTGITLDLYEVFRRAHDPYSVNVTPQLDWYHENAVTASLGYKFSTRYQIRFDYTNHILNYDAERVSYRNETDNTIAGYFYYAFTPKLSAFVQYQGVKFDYDDHGLNNTENYLYGGIEWDVTAKSKGTVKAGSESTSFDDSSLGKYNNFVWRVDINHNFDPKNSVILAAYRRPNETNVVGTSFYLTTGFLLQYYHRITGKIDVRGDLSYGEDKYYGVLGGNPRIDNTWNAAIWLFYQIKRWLRVELGYMYTNRNSNIDVYTYKSNQIWLTLRVTP